VCCAGCFAFGAGVAGVFVVGVVCVVAAVVVVVGLAVVGVTTGAVVVVVVTGASLPACAALRASRILIQDVMKSCQISAGNVPPATGLPWYSVSIGLSRSG